MVSQEALVTLEYGHIVWFCQTCTLGRLPLLQNRLHQSHQSVSGMRCRPHKMFLHPEQQMAETGVGACVTFSTFLERLRRGLLPAETSDVSLSAVADFALRDEDALPTSDCAAGAAAPFCACMFKWICQKPECLMIVPTLSAGVCKIMQVCSTFSSARAHRPPSFSWKLFR